MPGNLEKKIAEKNPWYVSDQFEEQWGNASANWVILNRWQVWKNFIEKWMQNYHSVSNPIHVLDCGCGDGINLLGLQKIVSEIRLRSVLYAIDYNILRLQRVFNRFSEVNVVSGNILSLPFADGSFHVILCNHVLEHIYDDVAAIAELARVLHHKGILIIGTPNEGCLIAQLRNHFVQPNIARTTDHVQFYTWPVLKARLINAGLNVLDIKRESIFLPHLKLNYILGGSKAGRHIIEFLQHIIPNQSAGLIALCQK